MDKHRINGSAKVVKGEIRKSAGKAVGDSKLKAGGTDEKVEGRVRDAFGWLKDAIRWK